MLNGRSQIAETVETPKARLHGSVSGVAAVCVFECRPVWSITEVGATDTAATDIAATDTTATDTCATDDTTAHVTGNDVL